jgi:hypothetical protein
VTPEIRYQLPNIDDVVGSVDSTHYLMNLKQISKGWAVDAHCYLFLLFHKKLKTRFGCVQCCKAFHPQYLTAFHFRHVLSCEKCIMIDLAIKGVQKVKNTTSSVACGESDGYGIPEGRVVIRYEW